SGAARPSSPTGETHLDECSTCGGEWAADAEVKPDGGYCGACEDAGRSYGPPRKAKVCAVCGGLIVPDAGYGWLHRGTTNNAKHGHQAVPPTGETPCATCAGTGEVFIREDDTGPCPDCQTEEWA